MDLPRAIDPWALLAGTVGLLLAWQDTPAWLPEGVAVIGLAAPMAAVLLGDLGVRNASTLRGRRTARWTRGLGIAAYVGLFAVATLAAVQGHAPWYGPAVAAVGLVPCGLILAGARDPAPEAVEASEPDPLLRGDVVSRDLLDDAPRAGLLVALMVMGGRAALLLGAGGALLLTGVLLGWQAEVAHPIRLGLVTALFGVASLVLGAATVRHRWRQVHRPHDQGSERLLAGAGIALAILAAALFPLALPDAPPWLRWSPLAGAIALIALVITDALAPDERSRGKARRVWLAREGIVEQDAQAMIVFPWENLSGFDLERSGSGASLRIWLSDDATRPFLFLETGLSDTDRFDWATRRQRSMRSSQEFDGAPLVFGDRVLEDEPSRVYHTLARVARDPRSVETLPSVLDDPPPVDLEPPED